MIRQDGRRAAFRPEANKPKLHNRDNQAQHRPVNSKAEVDNRLDLKFRPADDQKYDPKIAVQIGSTEPVLQARGQTILR